MHRNPRARVTTWFVFILLIGLLATACGGDDSSSASAANDSGAAATSDGGTTPKQDASEDESGDNADERASEEDDEAGSSDGSGGAIALSGPVNASIDEPASCGKGVVGYDYQAVASATDADDNLWLFQIYIENFEDTPGEYPVKEDDIYKTANVSVSDGLGGGWDSTSELGGTVVVADDLQSGTIETTLLNADTGTELKVSGSWVCEAE